MPTPSGTIAFSNINYEIRNTTTTTNLSLNDTRVRRLARAGGSGTTISMNNVRNKSITNLPANQGVTGATFSFGDFSTAFANIEYANDGRLYYNSGETTGSGSGTISDYWLLSNWYDNSTIAGQYEIRATQISSFGTASRSGTLNTWENLGTTRGWGISVSGFTSTGLRSWALTIDIRETAAFNASQPIVASHRIDLECEVVS